MPWSITQSASRPIPSRSELVLKRLVPEQRTGISPLLHRLGAPQIEGRGRSSSMSHDVPRVRAPVADARIEDVLALAELVVLAREGIAEDAGATSESSIRPTGSARRWRRSPRAGAREGPAGTCSVHYRLVLSAVPVDEPGEEPSAWPSSSSAGRLVEPATKASSGGGSRPGEPRPRPGPRPALMAGASPSLGSMASGASPRASRAASRSRCSRRGCRPPVRRGGAADAHRPVATSRTGRR